MPVRLPAPPTSLLMILFLIESVELTILTLSLYHVKFARRVEVHTKPGICASNSKRDIVARPVKNARHYNEQFKEIFFYC